MTADTATFCLLLVIGFTLALTVWLSNRQSKLPLPPGPPHHWLFGTEALTGSPWLRYEEMTQKYGPIFSLRRGLTDIIIIIGRYEPALEIMEKENAILQDRPRSISVQETMCKNMRLLMMKAGDRFKKFRRAIQSQLHARVIQTYQPLQVKNAVNLITDLLDDPSQHIDHAKRYAASVVITLTYGKPSTTSYSDPLVQKILLFAHRFGTVVRPGAYWVDSAPILQYVPGYLSQLRQWHKEELTFSRSSVDVVKEKISRGEHIIKPNFVQNLLEKNSENGMSEDEIAFLSGGLFLAGADTTASAISIMMMAAACFPEAQSKVQGQLDAVVDQGRAPTFADEASLPFITAFILECYRWRPRGYRIPAGATVIGSHWSIGRSPDVFPEPEKFRLERWLDDSGNLRDDIKSMNFGFGRRVCPGQQLANRSLFITTAFVLWAFRLKEVDGSPIDTHAFTQTANLHPLPFALDFEPRIPKDQIKRILTSDHETLV
ncbi:cytochrome P450 [Desarmillaria tabescens]|uniref:Cytochrome P450 n=1 Tax=Armillaria tabescens TaxID=1929756 RepID=A0AA39T726_ARMTA|nr:cytochrome P450 [Desarmillaria tabescens]KAK0469016.1 cytochrome P450 [Desarmillaria tabescens]